MLGKKKKVFVLMGMVALLVLTGVLNIVLSNTVDVDDVSDSSASYSNFFTSYKLDRDSSREESFLYYDAIILSTDSSGDAIADAESAKLALTTAIETELVLEGLIKALGFEDAIVTSSTSNINVIVKCDELTTTQATQIMQIIVDETGVSSTNVRIYPTE